MRTLIICLLALQTLLLLALAFYTVHTTGSTAGVADIANSKLLWISTGALAVAAGLRKK
jgi:hypothetical protein